MVLLFENGKTTQQFFRKYFGTRESEMGRVGELPGRNRPARDSQTAHARAHSAISSLPLRSAPHHTHPADLFAVVFSFCRALGRKRWYQQN